MKARRASLLLATTLSLAGCATLTVPTQEQLATADYGPPPPSNTTEVIKQSLLNSLKDPDSLKDFSVFPSEKAWFRIDRGWIGALGGKPAQEFVYCWRVPFQYNAKNSYGGYVGTQLYYQYYKDGELLGTGFPTANGDMVSLIREP